jgi:Spy/CpxP family protein refolding chaperone
MRTLSAVLTLVLTVSVGADLRAGDKEKENAKNEEAVILVERIQDLNLTDEQEAKITDIRKECRPKVQEAAKGLASVVREEVESIRDVLTADQKQKIQALKEEHEKRTEECLAQAIASFKDLDFTEDEMAKIQDIRKEFRPKVEKAMKELGGLLTDAQKKAREQAVNADKKRKEVVEALNLTADQKEKVASIGKEVAGLFKEELDRIQGVLSAEQGEKLQDLKDERKEHVRDRLAHGIANFKDLNLTDEQRTKIADIRKEYRPKVQEAGNKLRAAVREEVAMILGVIKG